MTIVAWWNSGLSQQSQWERTNSPKRPIIEWEDCCPMHGVPVVAGIRVRAADIEEALF
jgi:hypothetical protein